jgi:preprotein translocase subunit SecG
MLKRHLAFLFFAFTLVLAFPRAARADGIAVPDNGFYNRHRSACVSLNRSFYANGKDGSVSLVKEPGTQTEVISCENGTVLYVMFTYVHNRASWGLTEVSASSQKFTGWIPMDDLLLVYDYISFAEDHADELLSSTAAVRYAAVKEAEEIVFYTWPGSGVTAVTMDKDTKTRWLENNSGYSQTSYTDGEGRDWALIGYAFGIRNVWLCLSDPANAEIPAFNPVPAPALWQPGGPPPWEPPIPLITGILIAVVMIVTVVLIRVGWKQKPRKPEQKDASQDV